MRVRGVRHEGLRARIQDFKVYRFTEAPNYVRHYTTRVVTIDGERITGLDGFSLTDTSYISYFTQKRGLKISLWNRCPRYANAIFLAKFNGDYFIPRMSRDIMGRWDDTVKFYMKPLLKRVGIRLEDINVIDEDGNTWSWSEYEPEYFPIIKPSEYAGIKPDLTLLVYDSNRREHTIDVFSDYYVYTIKTRTYYEEVKEPLFAGYLKHLADAEVIPPIEVGKERLDLYRVRSRSRKVVENTLWYKLTDYEWCGAWTESQRSLEDLYERLKQNIGRGYDMVCSVIHYSTTITSLYVDLWVRGLPYDYERLEEEIARIQDLETREIIENVLLAGLRD